MKTRNLIFICLMCLVGGFLVYPIVIRTEPIMDTDTLYVHSVSFDTIIQEVPKVIKQVYFDTIEVSTTVYKPIRIPIDTAQLIAQYFSVKYYDDVLKDDSTGYVRLKEKVYQSSIIDRELFFESRCTNQVITNVIPARGLYFNSTLSIAKGFVYPTVGITYLRDKSLYSAGFGYYKNPVFTIGYGFKLR